MKKRGYHIWTIREINHLRLMADEMMTTKQSAEVLGVSRFSVKKACSIYRISFFNSGWFKPGHDAWNKKELFPVK